MQSIRPVVTPEEYQELQKYLQILNDETRSPGERRIAMAKFDEIYNHAYRRTVAQQELELTSA